MSGPLTLAAFFVGWQVAIATGLADFQFLPTPTDVAAAAASLLATGTLLSIAAHTLSVAVVAWLLATAVGVAAGALIGLWRPARAALSVSVDVLRTLPVVAFVPVAVLMFGLSTTMEIAVAGWAAVWPVLVNARGGVERVHPRLHEVAAVLRVGTVRWLRVIVLPAAAPVILVGARLGLSFALIVTVVAEMIGNPAGLGYEIVQAQQSLRPDDMFAYILTVGLLGVGLNAAVLAVTRWLAPNVFGVAEQAGAAR